jgi:hypothetical protein
VQVRVKEIAQRVVELEVVDPPPELPSEMHRKPLEVVSLVGFKSNSSSSSKQGPKKNPGKSDAGGAPGMARGQLDQQGRPMPNQGQQFENIDALGYEGPPINYSQDGGYKSTSQSGSKKSQQQGNQEEVAW